MKKSLKLKRLLNAIYGLHNSCVISVTGKVINCSYIPFYEKS